MTPRAIQHLFRLISSEQDRTGDLNRFTVFCSFLQIYNENLYDLLQDNKLEHSLKIREDKLTGIFVEGLAEYVVTNAKECYSLMRRGERNRITKATKANIHSSRSHSIFQLWVETDQVDKRGMLKRAKLNLCDLAGSEKINKEENMSKVHFTELKTINLSLTTLGKVISALSKSKKLKSTSISKSPKKEGKVNSTLHAQSFKGSSTGKVSSLNVKIEKKVQSIPYRESKLTRLLQDSLGGNTRTWLIATVSPTIDSADETISTLKFADRAKQVMIKIKVNELDAADETLVK